MDMHRLKIRRAAHQLSRFAARLFKQHRHSLSDSGKIGFVLLFQQQRLQRQQSFAS